MDQKARQQKAPRNFREHKKKHTHFWVASNKKQKKNSTSNQKKAKKIYSVKPTTHTSCIIFGNVTFGTHDQSLPTKPPPPQKKTRTKNIEKTKQNKTYGALTQHFTRKRYSTVKLLVPPFVFDTRYAVVFTLRPQPQRLSRFPAPATASWCSTSTSPTRYFYRCSPSSTRTTQIP